MATSGYCYSTYADDSRLFVKWTRTGTWNGDTCGSNIKWELYLDNGDWWYTNAIRCYKIYINGVAVYSGGTWSDYTSKKNHLLASGTTSIEHANNGAKSFTIEFTGWFYDGAPSPNVSASDSFTLDTIPRASSFGSTTGNMFCSDLTVGISSHDSSFHHKLYYSLGNTKMQLAGTTEAGDTSITFVPPLSLCNEIPDAKVATVELVLRTYSGSNQIGSDTYGYVKLYTPASIGPSISSISVSEGVSGLAAKFGCYVQSKSRLNVSISASSQYGATIKSYMTVIANLPYVNSSFTSGVINSSGAVSIKTTVTDTRGYSATKITNVTVVEYSNPSIPMFAASRCNSDGTPNDEGTRVKLSYKYSISAVNNKNDKTVKLQYLNGSTWTDLTTLSAYSADSSYITPESIEFSVDNDYTFRIVATDYFAVGSVLAEVDSSFSLINFHKDGKSFAIGKASQIADTIECAIKWIFEKAVTFADAVFNKITLGKYTDRSTLVNGGIAIHDLRDVTPVPEMFGEQVANIYFDQTSEAGTIDNWKTILSVTGWRGGNYATHELAFNADTTAGESLYHRDGVGSWTNWRKILDSSNYDEYALPLSGGMLTGPVTLTDAQSILASSGNALVGFNTSLGTGSVFGEGLTATYIRSSTKTNLVHRVGTTNHTILTTANYDGYIGVDVIVADGSSVTSASWTANRYKFIIGEFIIGSNTGRTNVVFTPTAKTILVADETNFRRWTVTTTGITKESSTAGYIKYMLGVRIADMSNTSQIITPGGGSTIA